MGLDPELNLAVVDCLSDLFVPLETRPQKSILQLPAQCIIARYLQLCLLQMIANLASGVSKQCNLNTLW